MVINIFIMHCNLKHSNFWTTNSFSDCIIKYTQEIPKRQKKKNIQTNIQYKSHFETVMGGEKKESNRINDFSVWQFAAKLRTNWAGISSTNSKYDYLPHLYSHSLYNPIFTSWKIGTLDKILSFLFWMERERDWHKRVPTYASLHWKCSNL